jgi:putative membrane protein insertion efficiency factor
VALELWLIGFYKDWISPLLPRACRFVPTCSSYGMQAYAEHGAAKGLVLTAWRIARCNPLGGSGFDPPRWPPVAFGAGSTSWWRETLFWIEREETDVWHADADGRASAGGGERRARGAGVRRDGEHGAPTLERAGDGDGGR